MPIIFQRTQTCLSAEVVQQLKWINLVCVLRKIMHLSPNKNTNNKNTNILFIVNAGQYSQIFPVVSVYLSLQNVEFVSPDQRLRPP